MIGWPLGILLVLTIISWIVPLDLWVSQQVYAGEQQWPIGQEQPWKWFHAYGPLPGIVLAVGALIGFIVALFKVSWRQARRPLAMVAIAAFVGPALVVNFIFKDYYGRPRPSQIVEFDGGERSYLYVWVPGKEKGGSFPSGHASIGFYLMMPYFALLAWRRKWAYAALAVGVIYGLLMGVARILQGGHFVTDVVWAGGMVYFVGYGLYYAFGLHRQQSLSS
ncbi:MAG: phosphatase PAP2 family protein [Verrucomicrobiota bacterium]